MDSRRERKSEDDILISYKEENREIKNMLYKRNS